MFICVWCWKFPVVSETFIRDQIENFIMQGHKVHVFCFVFDKSGMDKLQDLSRNANISFTTFDFPETVKGRLFRAVKIFLTGSHLYKTLKFWKYGPASTSLRLLISASVLRKVKHHKFDIIHCHFADIGSVAVALRDLNLIDGPIVTTFHGRDITAYPRKFGKSCFDFLFRSGDAFTANSRYTKDVASKLGASSERTSIIPMGVDFSKIKFHERKLENTDIVRVLTVARLSEKKGLVYSVLAFEILIKRGILAHYEIIGEGPLRGELEKLISEKNLSKHITLSGAKSQSEVFSAMRNSHMFVLTSVTASDGDTEGQGVVLIEAQASGLPVIVTRHNGFPDSVLEDKSGYIVPERDVSELAERMIFLATTPSLWPAMGQNGAAFVKKSFDREVQARQLEKLFKSL